METVIFYVVGAITFISACFVIFLRRPLHNVLFMILTMIGIAGLYVLLHAEFVAMVQLIVYAGAVLVLFLFVVMLLNLDQLRAKREEVRLRWLGGVVIAVLVLVMLIPVLRSLVPAGADAGATPGVQGIASNTQLLAKELFTTYLLPFEIASILLLAAIIGAVILVRKVSAKD
jgi:NADH-quinone oxidoreductase subunit J